MFYRRLYDDIKDELSKEERLKLLIDYITKAIKIDNRLYKRRFEKARR